MQGGRVPRLDHLNVVWRRLLRRRLIGRSAWFQMCHLAQSRSCAVVPDARLHGKWALPGEIECAEDSGYIRSVTDGESTVYVRPVTGSLLFGSPFRRLLGLPQPNLPSQSLSWSILADLWFSCRLVWWRTMSSGVDLPAVNQTGAATAATDPLPGTLLGLGLDLRSDRLYDLAGDIPDVMGLRAIQPRAAMVKVMSVPDSCCVRVVTPDDHVSIGFHEILMHNLEDEELPFVALSELGCLRLDWPRTLLTFMSRYQFDLDQMRKECQERIGYTQTGACTTCGKYILQNLGRHIALYHMELAQPWRCPETWCTVWKGTAQDCVDHMRRAHDIPPLGKAANLARWFPPWTVTREQWSSMTRYRVFDRPGTHRAFRGTYMQRMHTFLDESDVASLRRHHRRCAWEIAARMSRTSLRDTEDRTPEVSSRPRVSRRSGSRVRKFNQPAVVACSSVATGTVRPHRSEGTTIRALMDLALPKFADSGDRPVRSHRPWIVMTDSPASPAPVCSTGLLRLLSPCLNLDALSSDEDKESAGQSDILAAPICGSDGCHTPINSDQVLTDEDLLAAAGAGDRRQVIRIRDVSPDVQIVDISQVGRDWDSRRAVWGAGHPKDIPGGRVQQSACVNALAPKFQAGDRPLGSEAANLTPVVGTDDILQVGRMEMWGATLTVRVVFFPAAARHIRFLLVWIFSGLPPCVGYFHKFQLGVSSDCSLFLSSLCWGGGG